MLLNYIKIAYRYLLKNRTFSVINIFGLTVGFLCFALIALYLHDELNFDMFHRDASRIYRVIQHEKLEDGTIRAVAPVAARIAPESAKQLPEVEDAVRISVLGRITVGNDPANRSYEPLLTADPNIFSFFDFPFVAGDPVEALQIPDAVVISETFAKKYFGNEPALGKRIWTSVTRDRQSVEVLVTGVMKDFPKNSHIRLDIIFSDKTWSTIFPWYDNFMSSDWSTNSFLSYIKLKPGADKKAFETKLSVLVKANYPTDQKFASTYSIQPLSDIHLYSENIQGVELDNGAMKPFYLYLFAAVAFLILLIACLNYMNLSTAAATKRTREIGTRKTLGALKSQLIAQFSGEAVILSAVSLILAVSLLQVVLPAVNEFTEKDMGLSSFSLQWILGLILTMVAAGLLSSLYPAYIVSRVSPAEALKKDVRLGNRSLPVRKLLVVAQFSVSILMIVSTLVIYRQLEFMRNKELGFDLENLLVVDINSDRLRRNFENVKAEFNSLAEVQSISTSTRVPGEWKSFPITTVNPAGSSTSRKMIYVGIDQDFLSTYNIKLLEGRNFVSGRGDSAKVILTKMAVEQLKLTNPIGQIIEIPTVRRGGGIDNLETPFRAEVIGVADNFHFESFRQKMMPLIFASPNTVIQRIDYYTLRIKTNDWDRSIARIKEVNTRIDADNPLEYTFLNGRFESFYRADEKRGQIFLVFSCIIVLIACLGLFALVSFSIESRTKEIGIRKVLGASVESIVGMVAKEFLLLVVVAGVISIPVAWYIMSAWLQDFAYHVNMGAGVFILASVIAVAIAFITVSFKAIRAAVANPVNSLRSE